MRIPNRVVCLWSCLAAFTFIHAAVARDYPAEPLSGAEDAGGVTRADYVGSALLATPVADADYGQEYAPLAYDDGNGMDQGDAQVDPGSPAFYPPPMAEGYPPPMVDPNMNYYPEVSPFAGPVLDRTYRRDGIWQNEGTFGNRQFLFSTEYLRTSFNRPGTDLIGDPRVGVPANLGNGAYQAVSTGVFANGNDLLSDGIRAKFTIQNPDSSALEISGFWIAESTVTYQPHPPGKFSDPTTFLARGFLGLHNGPDPGIDMRFDTAFKLQYKQQAFGADMTWATMPVYESSGFRLRPTFGVKYLKVRELFSLYGQDSNLSYTPGAGGSANTGTVLPNPFGNPPFTSSLTSRTTSDIVGPEAGIRYEVGGQNFLLWGQSRFAVAANHETVELFGNQIGDGFGTGFPVPTPTNPKPAAFHDGQSHTHVSPIFSQDFYFKAKVFKHIPLINDFPLLANADVLLGYNFVLVGNVVRPTKVIDWRVDDPRIDLSRSRWNMQAMTFGLQWQF